VRGIYYPLPLWERIKERGINLGSPLFLPLAKDRLMNIEAGIYPASLYRYYRGDS
jgi:hypothetical protein